MHCQSDRALDALAVLRAKRYGALAVVDASGVLVGELNLTEVCTTACYAHESCFFGQCLVLVVIFFLATYHSAICTGSRHGRGTASATERHNRHGVSLVKGRVIWLQSLCAACLVMVTLVYAHVKFMGRVDMSYFALIMCIGC